MKDQIQRLGDIREQRGVARDATSTERPAPKLKIVLPPAPTEGQHQQSRRVGVQRIKQAEERDRRKARWVKSGFPRRQRDRAWSGDVQGDAWLAEMQRVLDDVREGRLVAMLGPWGYGKTQMSASVACHMCMEHGRTVRYWRTADFLGTFKQKVYNDGESERGFFEGICRTGLLILDEMDDRHESETEDLVLRRLIDHRYGEILPTIVISNRTEKPFGEAMGRSIMSRIDEWGRIVEFKGDGWQNHRKQ